MGHEIPIQLLGDSGRGERQLLEGEVELFIMGWEQKPESELKLGMCCGWDSGKLLAKMTAILLCPVSSPFSM